MMQVTFKYEIKVDGVHAATVTVKDRFELLTYVARIRAVYDTPMDEYDGVKIYADIEEGGIVITATPADEDAEVDHCHCGAAYGGSDHCPVCACEQYETPDCGYRDGFGATLVAGD